MKPSNYCVTTGTIAQPFRKTEAAATEKRVYKAAMNRWRLYQRLDGSDYHDWQKMNRADYSLDKACAADAAAKRKGK